MTDESSNKTPSLPNPTGGFKVTSLSGVHSSYTQRLEFTPTKDAEKPSHARLDQDKRTYEEPTCNSTVDTYIGMPSIGQNIAQ